MCSVNAQTFQKGDMILDVDLGFGTADAVEFNKKQGIPVGRKVSTGTFTQKIAFEIGAADYGFGSFGIGAMITNAYGFGVNGVATGIYDYSYKTEHYRKGSGRFKWEHYNSSTVQRKGMVSGDATTHVEDINILLKCSFHKQFVKNLDTYATLGLGASIYTAVINPSDDIKFDSDGHMFDSNYSNSYQVVFSYNDGDHVEWQGADTKARFAMALFVGARYYLTTHWALNCELGLTSASFKENGNVYNICSIGTSYKF